jgi:hypothetical protein
MLVIAAAFQPVAAAAAAAAGGFQRGADFAAVASAAVPFAVVA